jgi:hypothetical protein
MLLLVLGAAEATETTEWLQGFGVVCRPLQQHMCKAGKGFDV